MTKKIFHQPNLLILAIIFAMTGCADTTEQESHSVKGGELTISESIPKEAVEADTLATTATAENAYESLFKEDSFLLQYDGSDEKIRISLADCDCEYSSESFRIYSTYVSRYIKLRDGLSHWLGRVIYLQTPQASIQLFPNDYRVDAENGSIYVLFADEEDTFISMYAYSAGTSDDETTISGAKTLTPFLVEEWLLNAHELETDGMQEAFFAIKVKLNELAYKQGDVILKGEACGIDKATGKKYYIDWEWNDTSGKEKITPCILRVYDKEKDKEIFTACEKAFDQIEQGDWSVVAPFDGKERLAERDTWKWQRADVNGDNLPELISLYAYKEDAILPIEHIFAYAGGAKEPVALVYKDLNDYSEYLFLGKNGNLIYDYSEHGEIQYGAYSQYQFDVRWKKELLAQLEIYYFEEGDYYGEETDRYKEWYPDTYGKNGGGYYFFQTRPKTAEELKDNEDGAYWVREEITENAFKKAYQDMTGFDFFEENTDFRW